MGLTEVSNILWRERELLETLLFKLEEEQLMLASGRTRWLARATAEVQAVLDAIRRAELARAVEVDALAAELGMSPNPSLAKLAEHVPGSWSDVFRAHRQAFLDLTQEISALAEANRDFLTRGQDAIREAMRLVGGPEPDTYGASGRTTSVATKSRIIDEAM